MAVEAPKYTGGHTDWLRAAGVPEKDWKYADYIIQHESGWRVDAVNRTSGACSLAQALPCSKIKGDWKNPIVAIAWQHAYVSRRYGGYYQAYVFWTVNKWY